MTTNNAFNPDYLTTRTDFGNVAVQLLGSLPSDSGTSISGFIEITIDPKTESDCFHLTGRLKAEFNDAIRYELEIFASWFLDSDALPDETQLRDFAMSRGLFDLIAVMNHELRGLGIRYSHPYPLLGGEEIEDLREQIMGRPLETFNVPTE